MDNADRLTPDDVATIVEHMNEDHSDAVMLYVNAFTEINMEKVEEAILTSVDHSGIDIELTLGDKVSMQRITYADTGTAIELDHRNKARAILVDMVKIARARLT